MRGSFSRSCLLSPLPSFSLAPRPRSSLVVALVRLVLRLVLLVAGRGVVVLVALCSVAPRPYRPRRPRIARASRPACREAKRMPWLVSWDCSSCGGGRCRSRLAYRLVLLIDKRGEGCRPPSRACLSRGGAVFVSVLCIARFVYITRLRSDIL